jgi:hypothetical protein
MKSMSLFVKQCLGALLLAATITSCEKDGGSENTDTEKNNSGFGNISYFAKASGSGIKTLADTAITTVPVTWSSATVYVEKISFTGKSSNLLDTTITVEKKLNIFSADALAGAIKLPSGSYKDVKVTLYCKKSAKSDLAFDFNGTFTNTKGGIDSVKVGSSYPFEANLTVNDIAIDPSGKYKATFNFNLNKVLTGISNAMLQTVGGRAVGGNKMLYIIWKGGSADEPFYDQVIRNWQAVASVLVTKE